MLYFLKNSFFLVLADFMQGRAFKAIDMIPQTEKKNLLNVLSLDGGGIKGLVLTQVTPYSYIHFFGGVS